MKIFKKTCVLFAGVLCSSYVFASAEQSVSLINSSDEGYMEITYSLCSDKMHKCQDPDDFTTVTLYGKKSATQGKPGSISIEIPDDASYFDGLIIEKVVQKQLAGLQSSSTDKVIAKTKSSNNVCKGKVAAYRLSGPYPILELSNSEIEGAQWVVCSNKQS
jgi:hypothetical protein